MSSVRGKWRTNVVEAAVDPNAAAFVQQVALGHKRSHPAGSQPCRPGTNQLGEGFKELSLDQRRLDFVEVSEDADDGDELGGRIARKFAERKDVNVQGH